MRRADLGAGKIFLLDHDRLRPMTETAYQAEDHLQGFLARYPDLLAGDQIDPEDPRRWLLVKREMPVPGDPGEAGRWNLDHLSLDQDGIPTFVECKRASDTRSRRTYWAMRPARARAGRWQPGRGAGKDG